YRKSVERALQRAVAARDNVLRVVAHDLRNPLGTITMATSAMEPPEAKAERRDPKPLQIISRAAARMSSLIQDLLDVALVEAGQLKVEPSELSAADLVWEAVEMQQSLATSAGLDMRVAIEPDVGAVWGDRDRLAQVFENLIGNAIKFTPEGGRVEVRVARRGRVVEFAIADTGDGLAPESLSHVFDPFWQAATRAGHLGAGLGLPITKGIVEAHGGRIWVESTVGRGSTFFFSIPTAPAGRSPRLDARPARMRYKSSS
ncbi:MAG: sensor histidine kinase, partial [bacterium]